MEDVQPSKDNRTDGDATDPVIWVFVSYETDGGLGYARRMKAKLKVAGIEAWVWHDDRTIGEVRDEEIANKIHEFRRFVYICTQESHESQGQREERGLARSLSINPVIVTFDESFVSPIFFSRNWIATTPASFEDACDNVGEEIHGRERALVADAKIKEEGQPLEPA
jgi:hypothetical protein